MRALNYLSDRFWDRPTEAGDAVRSVSRGRSRETLYAGIFNRDFLPNWYELMSNSYDIFVTHPNTPIQNNFEVPEGVTRSHIHQIIETGRKSFEDNLVPIKAVERSEEEKKILTVGHLNKVIYIKSLLELERDGRLHLHYHPLQSNDNVEIVPRRFTGELINARKVRMTVGVDQTHSVGESRLTDIMWQMEYDVMKATFGGCYVPRIIGREDALLDALGNEINIGDVGEFVVHLKRTG